MYVTGREPYMLGYFVSVYLPGRGRTAGPAAAQQRLIVIEPVYGQDEDKVALFHLA